MFVKSAVIKIILVVLDLLAIVKFNAFYLSVKVHFFVETVSSMIVLFLYRNGKYVNVLPIERKGLLNHFPCETRNDVYINIKYVLIRNSQ